MAQEKKPRTGLEIQPIYGRYVSAVYMALLGPQGFRELGELVIQRAHYCARLLDNIDGIRVAPAIRLFKEFVVNFDKPANESWR